MVKGSVTISIEDFQSLLDVKLKALEADGKRKIATKELQVFLSYICSRVDISKHIDEFNRQSQTCSINIEDGQARIQLNEKA